MSAESEPTFGSYREIEAMYETKEIPVIDEITLRAMLGFFEENGNQNVGGGLVFSDDPTMHEAKAVAARNSAADHDHTFYGPYVLAGKYYRNGVGIWTMGREADEV